MWDEYSQEWVYQYPQQEAYEEQTYNADLGYGEAGAAEAPGDYYFFNTFSGQAVWCEPMGWQDLVHLEWNGWWLCREELTGVEYW